jgi:8-oxo-dGTP diphosphatase
MDGEETSKTIQRIAVGLIWRENQLAVGRRSQGSGPAGYDEFPGGKCEPGESAVEAVVRECLGETGLPAVAAGLRLAIEHPYEHGRLELSFFDCEPAHGREKAVLTPPFRWTSLEELPRLCFPPANDAILASVRESPGASRGGL